MRVEPACKPTVVLAVTAPQSLALMRGFPEYLAERGWNVHVLVSDPPANFYPPNSGVVVHRVDMAREPSPLRDVRSLSAWVRVLRSLSPDLVVSGTPKAGLLGMLSACLLGVPARLYWLRGLRLETESGLRAGILWVMEWCAARSSHAVLAVSESLRQEYVGRGIAPPEKTLVLGSGSSNGVDTKVSVDPTVRAETRAAMSIDDELVVGFVGRVSVDKGIDTLLEAVKSLNEAKKEVVAIIIGPEEPNGALDAAIRRTGVNPKHLLCCGSVTDLTPLYAAMDVLCLPTRREGFPNVVLEAAALSVPAIVTTATGAVDSVIHGVTGLHFPPGDSHALARGLRQLRDPGYRQSLGTEARQRVLLEFERTLVWERTERAFRWYLGLATMRSNGAISHKQEECP